MSSDKGNLENCSIGKINSSECHKKSYTKHVGLINMELFSELEKNLLTIRSGTNCDLVKNVCEHHKAYYLSKFESHQTSCFDPFRNHKKKITKSLRSVTLDFSEKINNIPKEVKAIPGFKICDSCREKVRKQSQFLAEKSEDVDIQDMDNDSGSSISELETSVTKEKTLHEINTSLIDIGESPFKFHAIPSHSKAIYAKRKIESACSNMKKKVSTVLEKEVSPIKDKDKKMTQEMEQKAKDLDSLVNLIKEKLKIMRIRQEKIQLLTLAPIFWNRKKVMEEFKAICTTLQQGTF